MKRRLTVVAAALALAVAVGAIVGFVRRRLARGDTAQPGT